MAGRSLQHIPFRLVRMLYGILQLDRAGKRKLRRAVHEHNYQLFVQRFEQRQQHRRDAA